MEKDVDRVQQSVQEHIRTACEDLVKAVSREFIPLQEHATKLRDQEERTGENPREQCSKDKCRVLSVLYEQLKIQHELSLSQCDSLRKQNDELKTMMEELRTMSEPKKTIYQLKECMPREVLTNFTPKTKEVVAAHPEIKAALEYQTVAYQKIKNAHTTLVHKLKQRQQVIEQMKLELAAARGVEVDEQARSTRLKDIIGPTGTTPQLPTPQIEPASKNQHSSRSRTTTAENLSSPCAEHSPALGSSSDESVVVVNPGVVEIRRHMPPPDISPMVSSSKTMRESNPSKRLIDDSEPMFVSERPAHPGKRRRTNGSHSSATRLIKAETSAMDLHPGIESASIDLDAMHTPIAGENQAARAIPRVPAIHPRLVDVPGPETFNKSTVSATRANYVPMSGRDDQVVFIKNEDNQQEINNTNEQGQDRVHAPGGLRPDPTSQRRPLTPKTTNLQDLNRSNTDVTGYQGQKVSARRSLDCARVAWVPGATTKTSGTATDRQRSSELSSERMNIPVQKLVPSKYPPPQYSTTVKKKRMTENTRLRDKDTNELTLNDFKLNPAMNQGFNDAIGVYNPYRSKKDCPAGCSNSECCGNVFLAAVRRAGFDSLTDLSLEQKDKLIETFLGLPIAEIHPLTNQEYQALLGKAIGKQFAQKYGKEKALRANSPPGFWRVGFPTTQERTADREEAEELEKATIIDRRREAIKGDGLWLFRDE